MAAAELEIAVTMLDAGSSRLAVGRYFIERGGAVVSQIAQLCECDYIHSQRELVARTGRCDGRCAEAELMTLPRGDVVCRRTRQVCTRLQVREELELWSQLNR